MTSAGRFQKWLRNAQNDMAASDAAPGSDATGADSNGLEGRLFCTADAIARAVPVRRARARRPRLPRRISSAPASRAAAAPASNAARLAGLLGAPTISSRPGASGAGLLAAPTVCAGPPSGAWSEAPAAVPQAKIPGHGGAPLAVDHQREAARLGAKDGARAGAGRQVVERRRWQRDGDRAAAELAQLALLLARTFADRQLHLQLGDRTPAHAHHLAAQQLDALRRRRPRGELVVHGNHCRERISASDQSVRAAKQLAAAAHQRQGRALAHADAGVRCSASSPRAA